jgi:hypothetical protein
VEDERQYRKVKEFRSDLKDLKTVIQYTGKDVDGTLCNTEEYFLADLGDFKQHIIIPLHGFFA